jgi:DNA-binding transcriptional LysR family regulator
MLSNLTLRQLRAFRAVGTSKSFTMAAEILSLTPAAVSGLIKELESQLAVRLLDRNTRTVELSSAGSEFFPLVERVLQDLDGAVESLNNLKELHRGVVRIAAPEVLSCTLVPTAMAAFRERCPQIELRFLDVQLEDVISRTRLGEVDLGIAPGPVSDDELEQAHIMRANLMLVVRGDDPLAKRSRVTWKNIEDRTFVSFFRHFKDWGPFERLGLGSQFLPKEVKVVRRINTAFAMVRAGFGVSACPTFATGLAAGFGLELIRLSAPEVTRDYSIFTLKGRSLAPPAEAFRDFLIEFAPMWARDA